MTDQPVHDQERQEPTWQTTALTVLGTVLGLASFFTILCVLLANLPVRPPRTDQGEIAPTEKLRQHKAEDERRLTTYELIDPDNGVWRIPIDVAIDKMVAESHPATVTVHRPNAANPWITRGGQPHFSVFTRVSVANDCRPKSETYPDS